MGRAQYLTRCLKAYDRELYCAQDREGKLCVYRNSTRWEHYELENGESLAVARPTPWFIFALTHDWRPTGKSVDWGELPILERLKAIDLWNRNLVDEQEADAEKDERSRERDYRNNCEGFLSEFRSQFKKTFNDFNVSSLSKVDRRRSDEKKIKNL